MVTDMVPDGINMAKELSTKEESFRSYKHRLDTALDNQFLRQAMDRFAVAYRTSRQNAFAGIDVEALVQKKSSNPNP